MNLQAMNLKAMKRQSVPLHAEVAAVIRHQIMSGAIGPGDQLPPLSELIEKLGVTRMTVKQAMDALDAEGLIERHSGRGTFVRKVKLPEKHTLNMKAQLSELHSMVAQMEVALSDSSSEEEIDIDGTLFRSLKRIHNVADEPFCLVELKLDSEIFKLAPEKFVSEIVISVLQDLGITVSSARQRVTISYADFDVAQALGISVNSAVFSVSRNFFGDEGNLIYSANLLYPGDKLAFDMEFAVDNISI